MRIARVELTQIRLPLLTPFETSLGRTTEREIILEALAANGNHIALTRYTTFAC